MNVLGHGMAPDHCLVALDKNNLVGVLGIQTASGGFLDPPLRSMTGEYGLTAGLYKLAGLSLLQHRTAGDECYVDGIAVAEAMRGQGVGTKLIAHLKRVAKNRNFRRITLEVTNTNHRAQALYGRLGFAESRRVSLWPFNDIYGLPFSSVTTMEKELN